MSHPTAVFRPVLAPAHGLVLGLVTALGLVLASGASQAETSQAETSQASAAAPAEFEPVALENPYRALTAHADALVSVRFVTKVQMRGLETELDNEIVCVAIEPRGLVLCSQAQLGGAFELAARLSGDAGAAVRALPREIEVLLPDGGPPAAAEVIARDSDRDLSWLRLQDLDAARSFTTLDFADAAEPSIGAPFYQLRRLPRFFGAAPVVTEGVVAAVIDEPRRLIVPSTPRGWLGTPVFAADGRLLGLAVAQVPGADDSRAMSRGVRALPGQSSVADDMLGGVFLPAADIVRATALALEVHAADIADALE